MIDITLAGLLATLASGLITLSLLASRTDLRGLKHVRSLVASVLLFNLLVILGLTWQVLTTSPRWSAPERQAEATAVTIAILLLLGFLKIGWLSSLDLLSWNLLGRSRPAVWKKGFAAAGGFLVLAAASGWIPGLGPGGRSFAFTVFSVFEFVVLVAVDFLALGLILGARSLREERRRRIVAALGWILLALFLGLLIVALLTVRARQAAGTYGWINALALLLFNPLFYVWAVKSAAVFRTGTPAEAADGPDPAVRFGISEREAEIIGLVCRGKTNQEIADALCISIQTVKDHNYNIFRKTGVRNRTQLARLFLNRQADRPDPRESHPKDILERSPDESPHATSGGHQENT